MKYHWLSRFKVYEKDLEKTENIIDNLLKDKDYSEDDIQTAFTNMVHRTGRKQFYKFSDRAVFIKYLNINKKIVPNSLIDLSAEDQQQIMFYYESIVGKIGIQFLNIYNDRLCHWIKYYHKDKLIPLWVIEGVIEKCIPIRYFTIDDINEIMAKEEIFIDMARQVFKKQHEFKKDKWKDYKKMVGV